MRRGKFAIVAAYLVFIGLDSPTAAQSVWSGYDVSFSKANLVDPHSPENQDRITDNVWITRGSTQGIFNAKIETAWDQEPPLLSPADTEWATDINNPGDTIAATNWAELTFDPWIEAYGSPQGSLSLPDLLIGRNAVVHLISDNIYLDLRFTDWVPSGGGGFSYERALAPPGDETTGDYNLDGQVDAADYVLWRKTFGESVSPDGSGADGDGDGMIDDGDYDFWRQRFGESVPGSGGAVPEPGGVSVVVLAICWCSSMRRRTKR